jgi:predicted nuclease of predicted toxin-antitoxin system
MILLLDECLPVRLGRLLIGHEVRTVRQMNWLGLSNGKLLVAADPHIDAFITVDKNLVHQQSLAGFRMSVIVLRARSNKIEDLSPLVNQTLSALDGIKPGQILVIGP